MPRPLFRANFESGVLSQDWLRRLDIEQLEKALKTGTNVLLKAGGGLLRRPGTAEHAVLNNDARIYRYRGRSVQEDLAFTDGRLDIYDTSGSLLQTITAGVPWDADDLAGLRFAFDANTVFVFHQNFVPQVLTRASGGTWSRADFAFADSIGTNLAQPFYDKFNDIAVSMSISAYSGVATMTFSDDVLETNGTHVGVRFRYLTQCEVEITAVTDARTATVSIKDNLFPTLTITVGSSSGYKVGQIVEGSVSQVRAIVSAVPTSTTVRVVLLDGYEQFRVITTSGVDKDRLVGPQAQQEITGVASYGTPASTTIWDEALVSPARLYPSTGIVHRNRLFMAGFPQAGDVIVASSLGNFTNFEIGADDADAVNEELGDDPNADIRHLVSAEQLLVFTDRGVYYVPEAAEAPITPETIQFLKVTPEGCSGVVPALASEGALFINEDAGRLMAIVPTGNVRRSWEPVDLSEWGFDLLNSPVRIAVANGLDGRSERYVFVLNGDGTLAVMMYRRNSDNVGFVKWERGSGTWTDIVSSEDDVLVVSKTGSVNRLGQFGFAQIADDEVSYASAVSNRNGDSCELVKNKTVVLTETVASGEVPSQSPASGYTLGYDFAVTFEPASPLDGSGWRRRRIPRAIVEAYSSGAFAVNGEVSWPFNPTDDLTVVGTTQSREVAAFSLGFENDPVSTVTQAAGAGAPLDIAGITMEVS